MLTHAPWQALPGLHHGFLDRLACASNESWEAVVARAGVPLAIHVPRQVHGTRVLTAPAPGGRPEADGLATVAPGHLVGIVTADCVPVLLVDRARRVAAAVHGGWRGLAAGVLESALQHLQRSFGSSPETLEAALGPAVGGCCYEVGPEVLAAFRARTSVVTRDAWSERRGRAHLDLRLAARLLLEAAGATCVEQLGPCTACTPAYSSYRRDGAGAGRQLSFVGWA